MLSALYHYNGGTFLRLFSLPTVRLMLGINTMQKKPRKENGNEVTERLQESLLGLIDEISNVVDLPISVIEITDKVCVDEFKNHFP